MSVRWRGVGSVLAAALVLAGCEEKGAPPSLPLTQPRLRDARAVLRGRDLTVSFRLDDPDARFDLPGSTLAVTVLSAADAVDCAVSIRVGEAAGTGEQQHEVRGRLPETCVSSPAARVAKLELTSSAGARLDARTELLPEVAIGDPADRAPEPWPPDAAAPPALAGVGDSLEATRRNLRHAEQLMQRGKNPVNACASAMTLNQADRDPELEEEVKRVCVNEATRFWAGALTTRIEAAKKKKRPVNADCEAARRYLAKGDEAPRRAALTRRLDQACGAAAQCDVKTADSSAVGGLSCAEAEEMAANLRAAGMNATVVPSTP